jgi:hypothetical protein
MEYFSLSSLLQKQPHIERAARCRPYGRSTDFKRHDVRVQKEALSIRASNRLYEDSNGQVANHNVVDAGKRAS